MIGSGVGEDVLGNDVHAEHLQDRQKPAHQLETFRRAMQICKSER